MADIQTPDPANKLRRQYRSRNLGGLFLAEELVPVSIVDDLSGSGVADRGYPRDAIGEVSVAAGGAGNFSQAWWVPTGNAIVAKLHRILIHNFLGARTYSFFIGTEATGVPTGLTQVTSLSFLDARLPDFPNIFLGSRNNAAATQGLRVGTFNTGGQTTPEIPVGLVGSFGGGFGVIAGAANEAMIVTFYWTEYLVVED